MIDERKFEAVNPNPRCCMQPGDPIQIIIYFHSNMQHATLEKK